METLEVGPIGPMKKIEQMETAEKVVFLTAAVATMSPQYLTTILYGLSLLMLKHVFKKCLITLFGGGCATILEKCTIFVCLFES